MAVGQLARRAAVTVATGVSGVVLVDGAKRFVRAGAMRRCAVALTTWGLRGKRSAEVGAENLRLVTGDVVSEARERIGEQTPPPGTGAEAHGHGH